MLASLQKYWNNLGELSVGQIRLIQKALLIDPSDWARRGIGVSPQLAHYYGLSFFKIFDQNQGGLKSFEARMFGFLVNGFGMEARKRNNFPPFAERLYANAYNPTDGHINIFDYAQKAADVKQAKNTGGIDFDSKKMKLETKGNDNNGIKFNVDPAMSAAVTKSQGEISPTQWVGGLKQFQDVPGFMPVIINIQPVVDLKAFLTT